MIDITSLEPLVSVQPLMNENLMLKKELRNRTIAIGIIAALSIGATYLNYLNHKRTKELNEAINKIN